MLRNLDLVYLSTSYRPTSNICIDSNMFFHFFSSSSFSPQATMPFHHSFFSRPLIHLGKMKAIEKEKIIIIIIFYWNCKFSVFSSVFSFAAMNSVQNLHQIDSWCNNNNNGDIQIKFSNYKFMRIHRNDHGVIMHSTYLLIFMYLIFYVKNVECMQ